MAGCASVGTTPAGRSSAMGATAPAGRQEALNDALEELLLAREQARLGLLDEAQAAWDRAIAKLQPFAAQDPTIADRIAQIQGERDLALHSEEIRAASEGDEDSTEEASSKIVENPEPPLDPTLLNEVGMAAKGVNADYPIVLNDRVYAWLEALTHKLKPFLTGSIERSGLYVERSRQIFAEEGVPQDLVYLAHIESGWRPAALSYAAARGIFQFIPETGRRYGMIQNWWLDERADPEKSARASAAYLRDLYAEFGDWSLALASYNCGEGRVRQMLQRTGSKDFFDPANQRLLPQATRNYVPAIMAATLISKNPGQFGFGDVKPLPALKYETVAIPAPTGLKALAEVANADLATLRELNPALRRHATPPAYADYPLRVPVGSSEGFLARLAQVPESQRLSHLEHVVRRGENLYTIAKAYNVQAGRIRQANGMGRRQGVYPGMVLVIPDGTDDLGGPPERIAESKRPYRATGGSYTVQKGDYPSLVARKFGISLKQLEAWNGSDIRTSFPVGLKLKVQADRTPPQEARQVAKVKAPSAPIAPKAPESPQVAVARKIVETRSSARTHLVKRGETVYGIAQRYGVAMADLVAVNKLGRSRKLIVGQRLIIPARIAQTQKERLLAAKGEIHLVQAGETLDSIAKRYGSSVQQLRQRNNLQPDEEVNPGDVVALR